MGPQTPDAQSLKILLLASPHCCLIFPHIAYPMHALQTNVEVGQEVLPMFMPLTMLWRA